MVTMTAEGVWVGGVVCLETSQDVWNVPVQLWVI